MATQQRWQPNNNSSPMTMATWLLIGPCESASITQGMPQEHKVIATRARDGANATRGMPGEHKAILDRESQGNT
jgi:hypothetical protein